MKSGTILRTIVLNFVCNISLILSNGTTKNPNIEIARETVTINISFPNSSGNLNSQKEEIIVVSSILEPSVDIELNIDMTKDDPGANIEPLSDMMTENSETAKNILSNDTPIILTFSESSTVEFEKLIDTSLASVSQIDENQTVSVGPVKQQKIIENITKGGISQTSGDIPQSRKFVEEVPVRPTMPKNITEDENEEIPSFSEWAQKRLEEVEKNEQINSSSKGQTTNGKGSTAKLRWKNYASLDCGAKVIAANPESVSPGAILSPSNDEYKLNTCTSRIWFIVELCETIQTKKIDLANYELFSSSPKDFTVSVSDRYPTRDWSMVGKFTAKDERDIQSFDLDTSIFGKYIKVEIKSHYGSEHYCPISLFRAYGTSVFEVLQKEDPAHINRAEDDDDNDNEDDEDDHITTLGKENNDSQKNLFSSATDAVMSIVKRAAEVLGNKVNNESIQEKTMINRSLINICRTPGHMIYCNNCSNTLFGEIYELLSCKGPNIEKLVSLPFIYKALSNSLVCQSFGYRFKVVLKASRDCYLFTDYITALFPMKYIGAMCNEVLVLENNSVLNISHQFLNTTEHIATDKIFTLKIQESHINKIESKITKLDNVNVTHFSNLSLYLNNSDEYNSEATDFEDITYVSQIKPTRALPADIELGKTNTNLDSNKSSETTKSFETVLAETVNGSSYQNLVEPAPDIEIGSEGIDVLDDHLEHFISEFNSDYSQSTPISPTSTTNSPQAQKESIFLRLSNRIKALERNMSLSSQYLEELSRRYKKQVEEMQNLLEKTILTLQEESDKKDLRNKQLEDRLDNLTNMMESLIAERHNWFLTFYCFMFCICIFFCLYFFCRKPSSYDNSSTNTKETAKILCRKSIDIVTHNLPEKKTRRPSDQALKIVHCSTMKNDDEKSKTNQRKRKKKNILKRSNSVSNIKDDKYSIYSKSETKSTTDWVEKNHQVIEDIPFVLDESDHSTLEACPVDDEIMKIDSPTYMQSAFNFRFNRCSSQNPTNYPNFSDKLSLDESTEKTYSLNSVNNISDSIIEPTKKEKKSFKKLLKKVF